jgi:mono/diheme cytochrome c family protein
MIPRPRDFTLALFKYKSTLRSEPPTDDDLRRVVGDGLPASAMPPFRDLLSDAEIAAVVDEVKRFARLTGSPSAPVTIDVAESDAASGERGGTLYARLGCAGCHGADGRKSGYLQDAKNHPVPVRDLTAPWTFRGGSDRSSVWLRLTTGLAGSAMPSYADAATPAERSDLVSYLASIARRAPWEPEGRLDGPGQQQDLLRRGEYIVRAEMCGLCHTQINRTGIYRDDRYLAGGMRVVAYPHAVFVSRNLTSDSATGLGRWTEEQIMEVFRSGRTPTRQLNFWGMPWFYPHYFTPDDARAVARYLKSLPPVRNEIPPPLRYGVVETVVAKLARGLPIAAPTVLTYADGNFARDAARAERTPRVLITLQWVVVALLGIALIAATIRRQRRPGLRGWLIPALSTVGLLIVAGLTWIIYEIPALSFIPPEQIVQGATGGIPTPDPGPLTPEERALTARGQYLFTVASCAFCHGTNGSGGLKVSWRPFGTLWVRNITPDRETGIGAWTDPAIARAIRSGIAADGRALHWQGMIWDHASNWDEEDIRAIVSYLRRIPPVQNRVPAARSPSADDCETYSFWIGPSSTAGCADNN